MTYKVAITGNIAAGKSAVQRRIEELGFSVFDTDVAGHEALESESIRCWASTMELDVFDEEGKISRAKLGKIVFADDKLRTQLQSLSHPLIYQKVEAFLSSPITTTPAFVAVPLLFETGTEDLYDKVVCVAAYYETRKARLMERNGLTDAEARLRMNAQQSQGVKIEKSDFVIYNDGNLVNLANKVDELMRYLWACQYGKSSR
jgi:dephospho-CoA kinase